MGGKTDEAQQVRAGPDPRGGRLRALREEGAGAAQDRQGEEVPEVPEEADRVPRPGQEEAGGDAGRTAGHEEEGRRLKPLPPPSWLQPARSEPFLWLDSGPGSP